MTTSGHTRPLTDQQGARLGEHDGRHAAGRAPHVGRTSSKYPGPVLGRTYGAPV